MIKILRECASGRTRFHSLFSSFCRLLFAGPAFGTVTCSIAARLFIATAITNVFPLLSCASLYCPPQNGVRGGANAGRRVQVTPQNIAGNLGGLSLEPGIYNIAATSSLAGILNLHDTSTDANSESKWIFNIGAAFTTAAASQMTGDGTVDNVQWVVAGAITLGAGSTAVGDMKATGAIVVGPSATCDTLSSDAAIIVGARATSGAVTAVGAITLGAGAQSGGIQAGGAIALGAEATLLPGTYTEAAATSMTGTLYLDAKDYVLSDQESDVPLWTVKNGGALTTTAASNMLFINSTDDNAVIGADTDLFTALNNQVFWDVTGAITLGAGSTMVGDMKATGAVVVGASATCDTLSSDAAILVGASATTGTLTAVGAITLGAGAQSGALNAGGAIALGAKAVALSASTNAAITLGAGANIIEG